MNTMKDGAKSVSRAQTALEIPANQPAHTDTESLHELVAEECQAKNEAHEALTEIAHLIANSKAHRYEGGGSRNEPFTVSSDCWLGIIAVLNRMGGEMVGGNPLDGSTGVPATIVSEATLADYKAVYADMERICEILGCSMPEDGFAPSHEVERITKEHDDFVEDHTRLGWLAENMPNLAVQVSQNAISTPTLRAAIDAARKEGSA